MKKFNPSLRFSNIPIMNLRKEFDNYFALLSTEEFKNTLYECSTNPVKLPNLTWSGMPDDLITLMLQKSILGIESYLGAAVEYELTERNKLSDEIREKLKNPFSLKEKGERKRTADILYDKMPGLVEKSFKLSSSDSQLFENVKIFYRKIRNPVFHGEQMRTSKGEHQNLVKVFSLIRSIYHWIDSWYSAFPDEMTDKIKPGNDFVKQYINKSLDAEKIAGLPPVINGPIDDVGLARLKKRLKSD